MSKFGSKKSEKAANGIVKKLLKLKSQVYTIAPISVQGAKKLDALEAVSYTHLTLPTKA